LDGPPWANLAIFVSCLFVLRVIVFLFVCLGTGKTGMSVPDEQSGPGLAPPGWRSSSELRLELDTLTISA